MTGRVHCNSAHLQQALSLPQLGREARLPAALIAVHRDAAGQPWLSPAPIEFSCFQRESARTSLILAADLRGMPLDELEPGCGLRLLAVDGTGLPLSMETAQTSRASDGRLVVDAERIDLCGITQERSRPRVIDQGALDISEGERAKRFSTWLISQHPTTGRSTPKLYRARGPINSDGSIRVSAREDESGPAGTGPSTWDARCAMLSLDFERGRALMATGSIKRSSYGTFAQPARWIELAEAVTPNADVAAFSTSFVGP